MTEQPHDTDDDLVMHLTSAGAEETFCALRELETSDRIAPVTEQLLDALVHSPAGGEAYHECVAAALTLGVLSNELSGVPDGKERARALRKLFLVREIRAHSRLRRLLLPRASLGDTIGGLFQYVNELQADAKLGQAVDVLTLICRSNDEAIPTAQLKLGHIYRVMGDLYRAEGAFNVCTSMTDDEAQRLAARLGIGEVLFQRGDLERAAETMDSVIVSAKRGLRGNDAMRDVLGKAFNSRAVVAGRLGQHADVVRLTSPVTGALRYLTESNRRDRALLNVAEAMRELDEHRAAVRYAEDIARRTTDAEVRIEATILLYNLAIDRRDADARAGYRKALGRVAMPAYVEAEAYHALARDLAFRHDWESATKATRTMISIAERRNLGEVAARGYRALTDLKKCLVPAVYDFRPATVPARTVRWLKRVERDFDGLCEAMAS